MTALPEPAGEPVRPHPLLTVAEYAALDEDSDNRWELQEGFLMMCPSPVPRHNVTIGRLFAALDAQAPAHLAVVPDVDLDLELVPPDAPGFARRPDLLVAHRDALARRDREGGILRASEVVLVVEVVSRGSRRMDNVIKLGEYADAGIDRYWIVDLDPPVTLLDCHRTEEFGYRDSGVVTGVFTGSAPFPVRLELDRLG